jgi:hypothetical protein
MPGASVYSDLEKKLRPPPFAARMSKRERGAPVLNDVNLSSGNDGEENI